MDFEIVEALQTLVTQISNMDDKMDRIDSRLNDLENKVDNLEQKVVTMRTNQIEFESEMTRKVGALFDGYQQNLESNAILTQRLDKIS